jgi:signal transduction histidine kinase
MFGRLNHIQLLRYAGLFTWVCAGVPLLWEPWYFGEDGGLDRYSLIAWRLCYLAFGACYWYMTKRLGRRAISAVDLVLLLLLTLTAIGVSYFSSSGLGSILLMVIAGMLPWLLPVGVGVVWLVLQYTALIPVFADHPDFQFFDAVLQAALYVGFSSFVFATSVVGKQLAESSRLTERTRISRELHDLLGHHLTALSLNLEVATHLSEGRAQEHVRQAQSLAKLLLSDVREAVSQLRDDDAIELSEALNTLVEGVPSLDIRLDLPESLSVTDPARAQVLLRCAQEIITNAVKHAGARTLWLTIKRESRGITIQARDDGRGAGELAIGNGLRGMRERLAEFGGKLDIDTGRGKGFALDAWLPLETSA